MKIKALAIAVAALLTAAPAGAQTAKFTKIDCAASPLLLPPNFICFASNEVAGDLAGGDAETETFTGGAGESRVVVRKLGAARSTGYRWVAFGLLCDPAGKALAANDLSSFVQNVGFR